MAFDAGMLSCVLREINEHDKEYFYKDKKINYDNL